MSVEELKREYLPKYLAGNDNKFYNLLLKNAISKIVIIEKGEYKGIYPDQELLENYNQFLILYRREGNDNYINIAKCFRKAAHRIYRLLVKKGLSPVNMKFLNLVK
jgi:signal-transduction protein with cAMP-binding, CBS, and nucleotidyltransferase domain